MASLPKGDAKFYLPSRNVSQRVVVCTPPDSISQAQIIPMKQRCEIPAGTRLQVEVEVPTLVRINSYFRMQNGKKVKVRSYCRRAWDAKVVSVRIST